MTTLKDALDTLDVGKVTDYLKRKDDRWDNEGLSEYWNIKLLDFTRNFTDMFYINIPLTRELVINKKYTNYTIYNFKVSNLGLSKYELVYDGEVPSGNRDDWQIDVIKNVLRLYAAGELKER